MKKEWSLEDGNDFFLKKAYGSEAAFLYLAFDKFFVNTVNAENREI